MVVGRASRDRGAPDNSMKLSVSGGRCHRLLAKGAAGLHAPVRQLPLHRTTVQLCALLVHYVPCAFSGMGERHLESLTALAPAPPPECSESAAAAAKAHGPESDPSVFVCSLPVFAFVFVVGETPKLLEDMLDSSAASRSPNDLDSERASLSSSIPAGEGSPLLTAFVEIEIDSAGGVSTLGAVAAAEVSILTVSAASAAVSSCSSPARGACCSNALLMSCAESPPTPKPTPTPPSGWEVPGGAFWCCAEETANETAW